MRYLSPRMAKRGTTIPIAPWWYAAADRELKRSIWRSTPTEKPRPMTVTRLAKIVEDSVQNVSRCLIGEVPTLHLAIKISDALRVPRPVFLPQTEQEALVIHGALGLRAVDEAIRHVEESVQAERSKAQTGVVRHNRGRPRKPRNIPG